MRKILFRGNMVSQTDDLKLVSGLLIERCPICGREFSCNKSHHVYTAKVARRKAYYCSYSCYKQRENQKSKR